MLTGGCCRSAKTMIRSRGAPSLQRDQKSPGSPQDRQSLLNKISLLVVLINTSRLRNQITDHALQLGLAGALVEDFIELRDEFNRQIPAKLTTRSDSKLMPLLKTSRSCHVKHHSNGTHTIGTIRSILSPPII